MSYDIIAVPSFKKKLKRLTKKYSSLKSEISVFFEELTHNPIQGTSIGNNCYKIRFAINSKGKGKSGGARIITHILIEQETVYLISIYDKSEYENISDTELKKLLNEINK